MFKELIEQIRESKDLESLKTVATKCYNAYLDKIIPSEGYTSLCRMIIERFIYLNVPV